MGHDDYYREHLPEHLDAHGDLTPPWARFPNYERYTIGWRMGEGETWLGLWWFFLKGLGDAPDTRLAYLRRHAPAPVNWADAVWAALHPREKGDAAGDHGARLAWLRAEGLVAVDAAYTTWRRTQREVEWPWSWEPSPERAARYATRDLWFWSRHVAELRAAGALEVPEAPAAWATVAACARRGEATVDAALGLRSLAHALAAGEVPAPWQIGLRAEDFADSFEADMGYVDAFRLWGMSAFDDAESLAGYTRRTAMPAPWSAWVAAEFPLD
jgi:hypothetical protein